LTSPALQNVISAGWTFLGATIGFSLDLEVFLTFMLVLAAAAISRRA
jgi:hypothetical protein